MTIIVDIKFVWIKKKKKKGLHRGQHCRSGEEPIKRRYNLNYGNGDVCHKIVLAVKPYYCCRTPP